MAFALKVVSVLLVQCLLSYALQVNGQINKALSVNLVANLVQRVRYAPNLALNQKQKCCLALLGTSVLKQEQAPLMNLITVQLKCAVKALFVLVETQLK